MRRRIRLFLVLLGAAVVTWALWPRERLLPRIATRVADARDWNMLSPSERMKIFQKQINHPSIVFPYGSYHWLSNHEILVYRDVLEITRAGNVPAIKHPGRRGAALYDSATGKERPLTELTNRLREAEDYPMQVSPDGKRMLCWGRNGVPHGEMVDGSRQIRFPNWKGNPLLWMPDSRAFAEILFDATGKKVTRVTTHSVEQQSAETSQQSSKQQERSFHISYLQPQIITPDNHLLGFFSRAPISKKVSDNASLEIVDTDLNSSTFPARKYVLHLPPNTIINMNGDAILIFSPQGDRLVLLLESRRAPSFAAWIHRLWPSYKATPQTRLELWVCHPDGSQMHEVGHFPSLKNQPDPTSETQPFALQWTPEGKNLSFLYNQALYTVPAD